MNKGQFEQFKSSNERVMAVYFDRHVRALILYANNMVADVEVAEEVVQDAYVKLWTARERIENEAHIKSFLYVATRNNCIDHLRKARVQKLELSTDMESTLMQPDLDLLARMIHVETLQLVYQQVKKLPPVQQQIFKLTFIEGLSTEDIGAQLNMTPNAIFVARSKALSTLQRVFKDKDVLVYLSFLKLICLYQAA